MITSNRKPLDMSAVNSPIHTFFIAGVNYKKTDTSQRGQYAIDVDQYERIISKAPACGVNALFILSTCNRTEIYGFADQADQLVQLLCSETKGDSLKFMQSAYIKTGKQAVAHLFRVAAGLDSQLLGDYEIVGQLKQAFKFARDRHLINNFLERLFNDVLRSSKTIKNQTALSDGTISVSFAAVQYIKAHIRDYKHKNILVIGTGKIGRNTCKNLIDYLGTRNITLINRTEEKAARLAAELGVDFALTSQLDACLANSQVIITATNAAQPVIRQAQLAELPKKLILDLSVPHNVEESAGQLPHIKLVNVDELSRINDASLALRKMETPKAEIIIASHISEFMDWYQMRKNAPVLKAIKLKLHELADLNQDHIRSPATRRSFDDQLIQKVLNNVAGKMRNDRHRGCYYIQAIDEFTLAAGL